MMNAKETRKQTWANLPEMQEAYFILHGQEGLLGKARKEREEKGQYGAGQWEKVRPGKWPEASARPFSIIRSLDLILTAVGSHSWLLTIPGTNPWFTSACFITWSHQVISSISFLLPFGMLLVLFLLPYLLFLTMNIKHP
jgi:hypothetical protein